MKKYNEFLLEKRIAQIFTNIEVTFSIDVKKTSHVFDRQDFEARELGVETIGRISNAEMVEFIHFFKKNIVESIATGELKDNEEFVIKSVDRQLAMAIEAKQIEGNYWKLTIITVFRETPELKFRVGKNQKVFEK
jgi:hypothetical protein